MLGFLQTEYPPVWCIILANENSSQKRGRLQGRIQRFCKGGAAFRLDIGFRQILCKYFFWQKRNSNFQEEGACSSFAPPYIRPWFIIFFIHLIYIFRYHWIISHNAPGVFHQSVLWAPMELSAHPSTALHVHLYMSTVWLVYLIAVLDTVSPSTLPLSGPSSQ